MIERISKNLSVKIADNIRYRELLTLRAQEKSSLELVRAMIVKFVQFGKPDGTFASITEDQYNRLPLFIARNIDVWLNKTLLVEAGKDPDDEFEVTLPSGQVARYRTVYAADQFTAEKWAAKQPEYFTPYLIEATFTFRNGNGEFAPKIVEDILEMSVQDGYAMSQLIQNQEENADFFLDIWGEESESTSLDSRTMGSPTRKLKK